MKTEEMSELDDILGTIPKAKRTNEDVILGTLMAEHALEPASRETACRNAEALINEIRGSAKLGLACRIRSFDR